MPPPIRVPSSLLRYRYPLPTRPYPSIRQARHASQIATSRRVNQHIGGVFEPFVTLDRQDAVESEGPTGSAKPVSAKPVAPIPRELTIQDILPSDNQLEEFIKHKKMSLPIETQKRVAERALRLVTEDDMSPQATMEVLQLTNNKTPEITALANIILQTSDHGVPVAFRLYRIAMDAGNDNAAYSYANMVYRGYRGTPLDQTAGLEILTRLARKGHPYAQMNLAGIIARESGDMATVVKLYELAAMGGLDRGWTEIGRMYHRGLGVEQDDAKAFGYFRKGAQAGNAQSNFMLGVYYGRGFGLPDDKPDQKLAFKHYLSAAVKGLSVAQYNVGQRYFEGNGVAQSYSNAAEFYAMAAAQGVTIAQANLARMYRKGRGVPIDLEKARELFEKVARKEGPVAEQAREELKRLEKEGVGKQEKGGRCMVM